VALVGRSDVAGERRLHLECDKCLTSDGEAATIISTVTVTHNSGGTVVRGRHSPSALIQIVTLKTEAISSLKRLILLESHGIITQKISFFYTTWFPFLSALVQFMQITLGL
jgi:hypothetical protein